MSKDKWDFITAAVNEGRIIDASQEELERMVKIICLPQAHTHFPAAQWPQITETIRLMLLMRMSERPQTEALTIAKTALTVALIAAIIGCIQVLIAMGFIPTWESTRASPRPSPPAVEAPAPKATPPTAAPEQPSRP